MRNIHNGHYRPSRKLAARIASLMTLVMIVSDCLPGLAAVPERTFRENAVSVQDESNTEETGRNPATGSDGERKEENSLFDDQETGILSRIAGVVREGTYAGGFRWSLDRDGLLTVSGAGDMPGTYRLSEIPWDSYRDRVKKIVLEEGITGIGQYLFSHCENLTSLEIPESVSHIGEYAFYNCANLQEVILPDTAEIIDAGAFDGCPRLPEDMPLCRGRLRDDVWWKLDQKRTLTVGGGGPMPDGENWTDFPWFSCSASIEEIVVEEGITTIGSHAFESCENVSAVSLPQGITVIGTYGFWGCESLTAIEIPESVVRIREYAFLSCVGLTDVILPDSVTTIEGGAFSNCPGLPGNVPVAKDTYSQHLRWVVTSDGVMTVSGDGQIPDMGGVYTEGEDGEPYKGNWNSLWISIEDSITKIIIEEGITAIGRSAFGSCGNLVSVVLPESLTKIGDTAFNYCLKLSDIKLPAGLLHIGRGAFMDTSITSVVIPENVEFLSQTAFPDGTEFTYEKTAHPTGTPLELTGNAGFEVSANAHRQNYVMYPVRTVESNLWIRRIFQTAICLISSSQP